MSLSTNAPTQTLRDTIEEAGAGLATTEDLHTALQNLEDHLGLPNTETKDTL